MNGCSRMQTRFFDGPVRITVKVRELQQREGASLGTLDVLVRKSD